MYYRIRAWSSAASGYGDWQSVPVATVTTIWLHRGGLLRLDPAILEQQEREEVATEMHHCKMYRQYKINGTDEPRIHCLVSRDAAPGTAAGFGFGYHGVRLECQPMSAVPAVGAVADRLGQYYGLAGGQWQIGVDMIVYRDGQDSCGWHADDTQRESLVTCVVVESGTTRPVFLRPKVRAVVKLKDGDEEVEIFAGPGDCYCFDGATHNNYEHAVPKGSNQDRRMVLILRNGPRRYLQDNGRPAGTALRAEPCFATQSVIWSVVPGSGDVMVRPSSARSRVNFGRLEGLYEGNQYVREGMVRAGFHNSPQGGISGNKKAGCDAIVVSHHFEGDDLLEFKYSATSRVGSGALVRSEADKRPIRVFRSSRLQSRWAPPPMLPPAPAVYRYDGLYLIAQHHVEAAPVGAPDSSELFVFVLERCEDDETNQLPGTFLRSVVLGEYDYQ